VYLSVHKGLGGMWQIKYAEYDIYTSVHGGFDFVRILIMSAPELESCRVLYVGSRV
jgi:hypothetical protein